MHSINKGSSGASCVPDPEGVPGAPRMPLLARYRVVVQRQDPQDREPGFKSSLSLGEPWDLGVTSVEVKFREQKRNHLKG